MKEQWKTKGFYFTRFWELFCGLIEFQYFQTYHGNRRTLEFLPKTRKTAPTKSWNVWENITKFNKKQQIACNSKTKFKKIVNFQSHSRVKQLRFFFEEIEIEGAYVLLTFLIELQVFQSEGWIMWTTRGWFTWYLT